MSTNSIPKSHYVYEFSYPQGTPLAGVVFYVGKGTGLGRMDDHLREAAGGCECEKCEAIRAIWAAGFIPARRIVFESTDERTVLQAERERIAAAQSPHLTNTRHNALAPRVDRVHDAALQFIARYCPLKEATQMTRLTPGFLAHFAGLFGVEKIDFNGQVWYSRAGLQVFIPWMNETYPNVRRIGHNRDFKDR